MYNSLRDWIFVVPAAIAICHLHQNVSPSGQKWCVLVLQWVDPPYQLSFHLTIFGCDAVFNFRRAVPIRLYTCPPSAIGLVYWVLYCRASLNFSTLSCVSWHLHCPQRWNHTCVQRCRVRESLQLINPLGFLLHRHQPISCRKYSIPGPNSLWHIDGHHSLICWGFVSPVTTVAIVQRQLKGFPLSCWTASIITLNISSFSQQSVDVVLEE